MSGFYLGIDGGQSSTVAVIGNENGRVIGTGKSGPCNHVGAPERRAKFFSAVGESVRRAAAEASIPTDTRFNAVCAGFSGGAADKDALTRELITAELYLITHDAHIALAGASGGGPGIVVIAGTGSIAYGRNGAGKTARAGGWGYIFGDEGSAFDLVRQATRAALRHQEGWGPPTMLIEALLSATRANSANQMLHAFYTAEWPRERVAALAHVIDEAALAGDSVATDIVTGAAQALGSIAAAVRHGLFEEGQSVQLYPLGGVFESKALRERFKLLVGLSDGVTVADPLHDAARGALLEAYRIAGKSVTLR